MRIPHRHVQRRMPKNLLQRQDVPPIHHEVRGEGVAQDVGALATGQLDIAALHHAGECFAAEGESGLVDEVGFKPVLQLLGDRHRADTLRLCVGEYHTAGTNHWPGQALRFRPSWRGYTAENHVSALS